MPAGSSGEARPPGKVRRPEEIRLFGKEADHLFRDARMPAGPRLRSGDGDPPEVRPTCGR
ncbi:hypothetical protein GCM10010420_02380 [Streptomyces glaucosporus]|uniref:Uncharacterized protein n=1 Tax=Streptomyces glaucosporus TaxID=284044 RepID=A0ABP5UPB5_9ACTN